MPNPNHKLNLDYAIEKFVVLYYALSPWSNIRSADFRVKFYWSQVRIPH